MTQKVIVVRNPDKTCSIVAPAPAMFDPLSLDRQEMRKQGIDFSDYGLVEEKEIKREIEIEIDGEIQTKTETEIQQVFGPIASETAEQEILDWIIAKDVPQGADYRITDRANLPTNRIFRQAWHDESPSETVDVCINSAKEIKRQILREERKAKLEAADLALIIALESLTEPLKKLGVDVSQVEKVINLKKELRAVTKLDLPEDINALTNFVPEAFSKI